MKLNETSVHNLHVRRRKRIKISCSYWSGHLRLTHSAGPSPTIGYSASISGAVAFASINFVVGRQLRISRKGLRVNEEMKVDSWRKYLCWASHEIPHTKEVKVRAQHNRISESWDNGFTKKNLILALEKKKRNRFDKD